MKRFPCILGGIGILLLPLLLTAQTRLYPVRLGGHWGLMDSVGQVVVPPQYDRLIFKRTYWQTTKNNLHGALGPDGRQVAPPAYHRITPRSSEFMVLRKYDKYGFGSLLGAEPVPAIFEQIQVPEAFRRGAVWGKTVRPEDSAVRYAPLSPIWGGTVPPVFLSPPHFTSGISFRELCAYGPTEDGWSLYDLETGRARHSPLDSVVKVGNGMLMVQRDRKWALLNQAGDQVTDFVWDEWEYLGRNTLRFRRGGRSGTMDLKGKVYFETDGEIVEVWGTKRLVVSGPEGYGVTDWHGNMIYPVDLEGYALMGDDFLAVEQAGRWGLGDVDGKMTIPVRYDDLQAGYKDELYRVKNGAGWALVTVDGATTEVAGMSAIGKFQGPLAVIEKDQRQGLANALGEMVLEPGARKVSVGRGKVKIEGEKTVVRRYTESGRLMARQVFTVVRDESEEEDLLNLPASRINPFSDLGWIWLESRQRFGFIHPEDESIRLAPRYTYVDVNRDRGISLMATLHKGQPRFGLLDHRTGRVMQPPRFRWIEFSDFKRGTVARGCLSNGTFAHINLRGQVRTFDRIAWIGREVHGVAPFNVGGRYVEASEAAGGRVSTYSNLMVTNGTAADDLAIRGGKWGYIHLTTGKVLLKPFYTWAEEFRDGYAKVLGENGWGLIDTTFAETIPLVYGSLHSIWNPDGPDLWVPAQAPPGIGYMDPATRMVIPPRFDQARPFQGGLAAVRLGSQWGYLDPTGAWRVAPQFSRAQDFHGGYAWAFRGQQTCIVGEDGSIVEVPIRGRKGHFVRGMAWVEAEGRRGMVNGAGDWVVPAEFLELTDVNATGQVGGRTKKGWGIWGIEAGDWVLKPRYGAVERCGNYLWKVKKGGKYGLVDAAGEWVRSPDRYDIVAPEGPGCLVTRDGGVFVFLDARGQEVTRKELHRVQRYAEGLLPAKLDGRWGYLDTLGQWAIAPQFLNASAFSEGWALVDLPGRDEQVIDRAGQPVAADSVHAPVRGRFLFSAAFDIYFDNYRLQLTKKVPGTPHRKEDYDELHSSGNFFSIREGSHWRLYGKDFQRLNDLVYQNPVRFSEGLAPVQLAGTYGLFHANGEVILPVGYDMINGDNGLVRVISDQRVGYLDMGGNWIWKLKE